MTVDAERVFPARMPCLPEATAFVQAYGRATGLSADDTLRLTLVVEELFTNTVLHGHGGDCDAPIRVALGTGPEQVCLLYEDTAPPFDPLARAVRTEADLDAPAANRPAGGFGLALVARMSSHAGYAREDGRNKLRLDLRRERQPAGTGCC